MLRIFRAISVTIFLVVDAVKLNTSVCLNQVTLLFLVLLARIFRCLNIQITDFDLHEVLLTSILSAIATLHKNMK
jgi:hypothetical protein